MVGRIRNKSHLAMSSMQYGHTAVGYIQILLSSCLQKPSLQLNSSSEKPEYRWMFGTDYVKRLQTFFNNETCRTLLTLKRENSSILRCCRKPGLQSVFCLYSLRCFHHNTDPFTLASTVKQQLQMGFAAPGSGPSAVLLIWTCSLYNAIS